MGKKKRSSKSGSAPAGRVSRPPNAQDFDSSICCVCSKRLEPLGWTEKESFLMPCCGKSLCRKCFTRADKTRDAGYRRVSNLILESVTQESSSSIETEIPQLVDCLMDINAPCGGCGMALPKSNAQIVQRLLNTANAGSSIAQYCLGCKYEKGDGVNQDSAKARIMFQRSAEGGCEASAAALGDIYHMGKGIPVSFEEAKHWYERAPNHAVALNGLGHLYRDGKGVSVDIDRAMDLFLKSAEQGYPPGILDYALLLQEKGMTEESLVWLEKCAVQEEWLKGYGRAIASAQLYVASSLLQLRLRDSFDLPGQSPLPRALFWARRAQKNGNIDAVSTVQNLESLARTRCGHCKRDNPANWCTRCKAVSYCGKECQKSHWKAGHKVECCGLPTELKELSRTECGHCGKKKPKLMCSGCDTACYCDTECQKSHWVEGHKRECKLL